MKKSNNKLIFFLLILMAISNGCDKIYDTGLVPIPIQTISESIEIGSEWTEITPPQPLEPLGSENIILIRYLGFDMKKPLDKKGEILYLADDKNTRIEAVLYDDKGESYELGINGVGSGFHLGRKVVIEVKDSKKEYNYPDFPKDRVYTKLKIRSEIPLRVEKIEWISRVPR